MYKEVRWEKEASGKRANCVPVGKQVEMETVEEEFEVGAFTESPLNLTLQHLGHLSGEGIQSWLKD